MRSAQTIEVKVHLEEALHEFLIAEMADLGFESFVEGEGYLLAYIAARDWNDVAREAIERWLVQRNLPPVIQESIHEPENWNRRWEETVQPIAVGRFLVKPTWADVPPEAAGLIILEIDPKMSFGTGYHESTRLVLRLLPDQGRPGMRVLDAGTGTGILAIAAARLGASEVHAFDIDPWSFDNARENVYLNKVAGTVHVYEGSIEVAPGGPFDLILANINRNTLLAMMPAFSSRLAPDGRLILAGLLHSDRERVLERAESCGLAPGREAAEHEWWSVVLTHP